MDKCTIGNHTTSHFIRYDICIKYSLDYVNMVNCEIAVYELHIFVLVFCLIRSWLYVNETMKQYKKEQIC